MDYAFGLAPYLLSPAWLSLVSNTSNHIKPINGIKIMRYIHPLFPTSCNLLTTAPKAGKKCRAAVIV